MVERADVVSPASLLSDGLTRAIIGTGIGFSLLVVVGQSVFGGRLGFHETSELLELHWVLPVAQSCIILSALAISFLALGRYLALGGAWVYQAGSVFLASAILGTFYLLSWPGLLGEQSVIGDSPNTSAWFFYMAFSPVVLLVAMARGHNAKGPVSWRRASALYGAVTGGAVAVGLISLLFQDALPPFIVGQSYTTLTLALDYVLAGMLAMAASLSYRAYRREGDDMFGYLALFLVLMTFDLVLFNVGGKRYDFWWYAARAVSVTAYVTVLFGLLQEGYRLFGFQRILSDERARLLETVLVQNRDLEAQSRLILSQRENAQLQSEMIRSQNEELGQAYAALQVISEERRQRAEEVDAIIESVEVGIAIYDSVGSLVRINPALVRTTGFSKDDMTKPLESRHSLLKWSRLDGTALPLEEYPPCRALAGETVRGLPIGFVRDGQKRWVLASAAPLHDAEESVYGAVMCIVDVTEQRELERLRDEFLSLASHELKTPVTSIKGYAQLMLRRRSENLTDSQKTTLGTINRQCDRIDRLVQELLDVSALRRGHLELRTEPLVVSEYLASVVRDMDVLSEKHEVRCVDCQSATVTVEADRGRLEQVLSNLIGNAIQYSDGGRVDVGARVDDGLVVVSVRDFGVGIPARCQGRIFEYFYRARPGGPTDRGGMGVGLYISREIVRRHGGEMWFESSEGQGSTFYFSLPVAKVW